MRYFEKCVTSGSCLHLTVQKSRLWSYQKVIRLSSLIQSKLLEIIVDYIRGEQLQAAKRNPEGCPTFRVLSAQRVGIPKPIEASRDQHPTGRRKRPLGIAD